MTGTQPGRSRVAERAVMVAFAASMAGAALLIVVYWQGGQVQLEGVGLALALGGLGVGLVIWGRHLLGTDEAVDQRKRLGDTEVEREEVERSLTGDERPDRRTALRRMLVGSLGLFGVALVFPIRSLGPRPTNATLKTSPWREGLRLVDEHDDPIQIDAVPVGGLVTAFPEGLPGSADGQVDLLRVEPDQLQPLPGREDWSPDGLVAYSRVCTHAGCPVGLYLADTHELLCPCHQSAFDALDGARPTRGPAARPLPQLPLRADADGTISATGDFSAPVGPAWWSEP